MKICRTPKYFSRTPRLEPPVYRIASCRVSYLNFQSFSCRETESRGHRWCCSARPDEGSGNQYTSSGRSKLSVWSDPDRHFCRPFSLTSVALAENRGWAREASQLGQHIPRNKDIKIIFENLCHDLCKKNLTYHLTLR